MDKVRVLAMTALSNPGPRGKDACLTASSLLHGDFHSGNVFFNNRTGDIRAVDTPTKSMKTGAAGKDLGRFFALHSHHCHNSADLQKRFIRKFALAYVDERNQIIRRHNPSSFPSSCHSQICSANASFVERQMQIFIWLSSLSRPPYPPLSALDGGGLGWRLDHRLLDQRGPPTRRSAVRSLLHTPVALRA